MFTSVSISARIGTDQTDRFVPARFAAERARPDLFKTQVHTLSPGNPDQESPDQVPVFNYLNPVSEAEKNLVDQTGTNWNPMIRWLKQLQQFRDAS
jgi:hypothetical protein